ncbi:divalent metal cation transporter, partial [Streptomyces caniscabiei]|uniref:divalent metal cation transporter n=1 Tax=Streptomyces caniscabiei TaxID=2746961 RepID=UPI0038F7A25E
PVTYLVQEMVARLGIASGQGHAKMIQSRFGKMWGAFSHFDLQLINFLTLITEFAAISMVVTQLGISPYIGVPLVACGLVF